MRAAVVLFSFLGAAACTKPDAPGSCYRDRDDACTEFDGAHGAAGQRLCAGFRWTPGSGTCPREGRVGTCTKQGQVDVIYGGPPNAFTPASARSVCEGGGGTFAAPAP